MWAGLSCQKALDFSHQNMAILKELGDVSSHLDVLNICI